MPQLRDSPALRVGDRLPDLRLPRPDGTTRPLRGAHRDAVVVVALHDAGCDRCRRYLQELAAAAPRFRFWDGSVRAVTADRDAHRLQAALGPAVDVLLDADRTFLDRVQHAAGSGDGTVDDTADWTVGEAADGTADGTVDGPVVLVADRFGQVFEILAAPDHAAVGPRELEEWLKYLATQCPE